jgi:hypothetical protein
MAATLGETPARETASARGREFSVARAGALYAELFLGLYRGRRAADSAPAARR